MNPSWAEGDHRRVENDGEPVLFDHRKALRESRMTRGSYRVHRSSSDICVSMATSVPTAPMVPVGCRKGRRVIIIPTMATASRFSILHLP
jgi:hypothetical protein